MNTSPSSIFDPFLDALATLPELPKIIQYEDDYDEVTRTIKVSESDVQAPLHVSGSVVYVRFHRMNERVRPLLRTYLLTAIQICKRAWRKALDLRLRSSCALGLQREAPSFRAQWTLTRTSTTSWYSKTME